METFYKFEVTVTQIGFDGVPRWHRVELECEGPPPGGSWVERCRRAFMDIAAGRPVSEVIRGSRSPILRNDPDRFVVGLETLMKKAPHLMRQPAPEAGRCVCPMLSGGGIDHSAECPERRR